MKKELSTEDVLKEYKNFLRIVSHDMNAPLRQLKSFTSLLFSSIDKDFGDEEQEYVNFIKSAISRLTAMQSSLLTLSRITTNDVEYKKIDAAVLVQDAISNLSEIIQEHNPIITFNDLPAIEVNALQFESVFRHLIENALIYHEETEQRKITISSFESDHDLIFSVQDNGIGIEPQHKDVIFDIFRRLHGEDDYGGRIGAGLAIVKAIIERHGGKIWLDSEFTENGSQIYFSLKQV